MNKREKVRILKSMKKIIETQSEYYGYLGLCSAVSESVKRISHRKGIEGFLNDLGLFKPRKTYDNHWWYDPHQTKPRIRAINRAIKKLQS